MDVEDLALAQQLAAYRLGHGSLVELAHVGEDGPARGGSGVEQCQVPDTGEAHLQCARDGRGGEREHVHICPQGLDRLLVRHTEALFLVDHQQPEVLEGDIR